MKKHRIRIIGPRVKGSRRKKRSDEVVVNTTSRAGWSSQLSPFKLGPVELYDGQESQTMENGWQYSKVYEEHVDRNGNPTKKWLRWAKEGWNNPQAVRYPMGKGRKPLYSWWKGKKLDYVTARKRIYVKLYARAVVKTKAFARLRKMYENGVKLVLWDFDGYDHIGEKRTLKEVLNDPKKIMGHAFVLAMLLEKHPIVQGYLK